LALAVVAGPKHIGAYIVAGKSAGTLRLVPHRDVRGYLAIDRPFEQSDCTINRVACEPLWPEVKAADEAKAILRRLAQ
jgi:hypothetical protein